MSDNTLNAALRRLRYTTDDMTAHGFRSMASTLLNEQGCWNRDAIERQLAHGERDEVRAAYNYAEYLPEWRRMMQGVGGLSRWSSRRNKCYSDKTCWLTSETSRKITQWPA